MSISKVGRVEKFDFEVQDTQDRSWDRIMREAEKKAIEFVDTLRNEHELVERGKFKSDGVEVDLQDEECPRRTYKFVLEVKVWSKLG